MGGTGGSGFNFSGLGADIFAGTQYAGVSFDGSYAQMGMHEGRPYYGCGNNRIYVGKQGYWCMTSDPNEMLTNQLARHGGPGINIGLVSSGAATGSRLLPTQVKRWNIWNGRVWTHATRAQVMQV